MKVLLDSNFLEEDVNQKNSQSFFVSLPKTKKCLDTNDTSDFKDDNKNSEKSKGHIKNKGSVLSFMGDKIESAGRKFELLMSS